MLGTPLIAYLVLAAACVSLYAQAPRLTFEAASVKVSHAESGAYLAGGPGSPDPTRFTFVRASMGALLRRAYRIDPFQLATPSGLPNAYFDIHAKIPPGTTDPEFDEMLKNLLSERFSLQAHHESREMPGYELVASKRGVRMKVAEQPSTPPPPDIPVGRLPLIQDREGDPQLPPGRKARLVLRLSDGRYRYSGRMQSTTDIAAMCTRELGRPVTDRSGLTGEYDFNIDFMRPPDDPSEARADSEIPFLNAVQLQLGLRLVAKKTHVDVVVIDRMDKTPAEN